MNQTGGVPGRTRSRLAFTIPELSISMFVLGLMMLAGFFLLQTAQTSFVKVGGNEDATLQLRRATRYMQRDIIASGTSKCAVYNVPGSLSGSSGGFDSIAIGVLSCSINAEGDSVTKPGGEVYWQRNVLYYLTVPIGDTCNGGLESLYNCDDRCPHKVLIRKVIDRPPATAPTDSPMNADEVVLSNAEVIPYLTRPSGTSVGAMLSEPNVTGVQVVANKLLSMRSFINPDASIPGEIRVVLQAFNAQAASKTTAIGTASLSGSDFTLTQTISLFPRNNN